MSDDSRASRQVQVLKDLGLSRAEAEVYLACLRLAAGGAGLLSSYRVAQDMGRDPANIGKIVNTLVHLQAVRVVQEKPRLFLAVPPGEFTDHVLGRLRRRGAEAISLLDDFTTAEAEGVPLALGSRDQVLDRARQLLAGARTDLLVAGSPEVIRELGADLEAAGATQGRRVRVVSPQAFTSTVVEVAALPTAGRVGHQPGDGWLALAADDAHWLVASLPQETEAQGGPCGWWAGSSPVARVWAEFLETAWRAGVKPVEIGVVTGAGAGEEDGDVPAAAEPSDVAFVPGAIVEPAAAAAARPTAADVPQGATAGDWQAGDRQAADSQAADSRAAGAHAAGTQGMANQMAVANPDGTKPSGPAAPFARPLPAEEAEQAGFAFLFKHDRKKDGRRDDR